MAGTSTHVNEILLPGETVLLSKEDESSVDKIYLGPGLRKYGKEILVSKPGVLRKKKNPNTYWIDCHQKRVNPQRMIKYSNHILNIPHSNKNLNLVYSDQRR